MDPDTFKDVFAWVWGLTGEPHFHSTIILAGYTFLAARQRKWSKRIEALEVKVERMHRQLGHLMNVIGMRKHEAMELGAYLPLPRQPGPSAVGPDMRRVKK